MSTLVSIDHVFVFVKNEEHAVKLGYDLGLKETYRRTHSGQGTSNICYCFENSFLELIWVCDQKEIQSKNIIRTKLFERANFTLNGSCPFGISYRPNEFMNEIFENWSFYPPYLNGHSIEVALESENEINPLIFKALNLQEPKDWDLIKQNDLQNESGWSKVQFLMIYPFNFEVPINLNKLVSRSDLQLKRGGNNFWELEIILNDKNGSHIIKKVL